MSELIQLKQNIRNGKLEFLRFVFALMVLFYHVQLDCWKHPKLVAGCIYLAPIGRMGVEFFFLLSGYLMAKSVYRMSEEQMCKEVKRDALGNQTCQFVWRKIKSILPFHFLFFSLAFILIIIFECGKHDFARRLLDAIPNFLILNTTGLVQRPFNAVEWYLSSMFIAIMVLYPILVKFGRFATKIICPFIGVLAYGYLTQMYGEFPANIASYQYIMGCNIRALGGLSLGIFAYELSTALERHGKLHKMGIVLVQIAEVFVYGLAIFLMNSNHRNIDQYILLLLFIGIVISTGQFGLGNGTRLFQNKFVFYLGKISLPIYLCQNVVRYFFRKADLGLEPRWHFVFATLCSIVIGMLSFQGFSVATKMQQKRKKTE